MQKKNNSSYTFFLSHKTKTKIYKRQIEISKNIIHISIIGIILLIGIVSFGFFKNTALAQLIEKSPIEAAAAQPIQNNSKIQYKPINYDTPATSKNISFNTVESTISSARPVAAESDAEKNKIVSELRAIETTSNPAFLPTMWAHIGKINNEFGVRRNPFGERSYEFHPGLDIGGERGDTVAAPANGIVSEAGWKGGYGNMIEVDHGNGLKTRYGHLSKIEVQPGDTVERGQVIGLIGSTGRSTGPHLHYELRLFDKPINPRFFLPPEPMEFRG